MKKGVMFTIIAIVTILVVGVGIFYILKDDKKIVMKSIEQDGDKIVQIFEIELNDKKQEIEVEYTAEYTEYYAESDDAGYNFYGYINENKMIYSDGAYEKDKDKKFIPEFIKKEFNEENFQIIKGEDGKDYLLVITNKYMYTAIPEEVYIFNDKMELLTKKISKDFDSENHYYDGLVIWDSTYNACYEEESPLYKNENDSYDGSSYFKIEDGKIYYLARIFNERNEDGDYCNDEGCGKLEERVYTINEDELKYEVIKEYNIPLISDQT